LFEKKPKNPIKPKKPPVLVFFFNPGFYQPGFSVGEKSLSAHTNDKQSLTSRIFRIGKGKIHVDTALVYTQCIILTFSAISDNAFLANP